MLSQQKCIKNFSSQYAYLHNNECIHIKNYIDDNKQEYITCGNSHELICVNSKRRKSYFRHKSEEDVCGSLMSNWHIEWQGNFPVIEQEFTKLTDEQIKTRRCDVLLNSTTVVEFQHSNISETEVNNRTHDYAKHGKQIIWVIDGSNTIDIKILEYSNRVFVEFTSDHWKYESFINYKHIFIDIGETIYKIFPSRIKSRMIDVEPGKTKEEFIEFLNNGVDIWINEEPYQCNLFIKQQGAGNGKTYGIVKMLEDENKSHYKYFIYITKQHSAKHIIKTEFENQQHNFKTLTDIEITTSPDQKKYIIKYFNGKINCQAIISTIDAFSYSIGNKTHTYYDKFEGLIYSIMNDYISTQPCGTINFAVRPKLNKETLIVIDEFQDPPQHYAKAIIQIMRNKYVDVFIVGDKLQSISNEKNAFVYFLENEFSSINTYNLEATNICRRFTHPKLVSFVNKMVPFEKYRLPPITPYKEYVGEDTNPIIFICGKNQDNNNEYHEVCNKQSETPIIIEVKRIMKQYIKEVEENKRFPENFLVVTPFTSKNPLVDALLLAINIFWINKFENNVEEHLEKWKKTLNINDGNYYRYAIFHKSEEGASIDLNESEHSTRVVSCHSSKGDGREIVFVIGVNEGAIKKFSKFSKNLIYDSFLHVAITRMKERIYIYYLPENNDDITQKINKYRLENGECSEEIFPKISINKKIKYNELNKNEHNHNYTLFFEKIISISNIEDIKITQDDQSKRIIDLGNHYIRNSSLFINVLLEIVNKEEKNIDDCKQQIKAILYTVCSSEIIQCKILNDYYKELQENDATKRTNIEHKSTMEMKIPLLKILDKGSDYKKYYDYIYEIIKKIIEKIKVFLISNKRDKIQLCAIECIILNFMIDVIHNNIYASINIMDIYNIIDVYDNSFINDAKHLKCKCICKSRFTSKECEQKNKDISGMKKYLMEHFEKINSIKKTMNIFHAKYPKINWLYNQKVEYKGNNDNFKLYKHFSLIGYDDTTVIICYLKPQFNELNYNEVLMNSIFDTHLIKNINPDKKDYVTCYDKLNRKNVITTILTLDKIEPYYIDWTDVDGCDVIINNVDLIKQTIYSNIMEKYKLENNDIFYFFKYHRKYCPVATRKPIDFIDYLKKFLASKCNEENKIPTYIGDFFSHIGFKLEDCKGKTEKENILIEYENKTYFLEKLEQKLDIYVRHFLGMNVVRDDEDDN